MVCSGLLEAARLSSMRTDACLGPQALRRHRRAWGSCFSKTPTITAGEEIVERLAHLTVAA